MKSLRRNPLIKKFLSLNLPGEDYVIFGSAPMFFHGLIDEIRDLDVVVRGKAWEKTTKLGKPTRLPLGNKAVKMFGGKIEITNGWVPGTWDINKLIDEAKSIEGIKICDLETVLKWKIKMGRPKDLKHIKIIEKYLSEKSKK